MVGAGYFLHEYAINLNESAKIIGRAIKASDDPYSLAELIVVVSYSIELLAYTEALITKNLSDRKGIYRQRKARHIEYISATRNRFISLEEQVPISSRIALSDSIFESDIKLLTKRSRLHLSTIINDVAPEVNLVSYIQQGILLQIEINELIKSALLLCSKGKRKPRNIKR